MKKSKIVLGVLVLVMVLGVVEVQAMVPRRGNLAIGSHYSLPALGASVKYWFTDKWCGQLTFVPSMGSTEETGSEMNAYAGKVSYKLKEGRNHYFYGALSAGRLSQHQDYSDYRGERWEYEATITGVVLSYGLEWVPSKWFALSLEIGYGFFDPAISVNDNEVPLGEYETLYYPMIGIGIHSYF